ncbi:Hypothetical predicted protein [Mytilus galloprovincialis]|uniref:Transposase Helix-turn-helix domain-containing protein n=1 Tax=Mytilus galloprovincialis TaxID=29158 RepID=A0A8B6E6V9_MYTGA|nr:Hypothetical predicted protein [Mytilus galloprovincialis]
MRMKRKRKYITRSQKIKQGPRERNKDIERDSYGLNCTMFNYEDKLYDVYVEVELKVKFWSGKQSTDDVNYQSVDRCKSGPPRKLSKFHEYILTYMKLRLAISSFVLGDLFSVSEYRVSQIFTTWINLMHMVLHLALSGHQDVT